MNSNANNLQVHVDDAPPPPYSETDIYSASSHSRSHSHSQSQAHSPLTSSAPFTGAPEDAASRISSSTTGDVIFTPPLTPQTASNAATFSDPGAIPPSPSAALYFDDRPAPITYRPATDVLVYTVRVRSDSVPDDLPYPTEWAARDITNQDWATFVNFLIPDHDAARNEAILGEKGEGSDKVSSPSVEKRDEELTQKRRETEATIHQWNDGFFGPRGIRVQLEAEPNQAQMPGAWNSNFDEAAGEPNAERDAGVGPSSGPPPANPYTRNWGGIQFGQDSVRWGDRFVADNNGLRIGNLVMDNNGIRLEGGRGRGQSPGRGAPRWGANRGMGAPWRGGSNCQERDMQDRGRSSHHHGSHSRSSSSSSDSSSSSSSSVSSIGSLPDYDHLRDQQLPLYLNRIQSWINNPDQMRTKADVKQFRAEIKASRSNPSIEGLDKTALRTQIKTLSQQWRQLKRQQRRLQRERKRERKQRRRAEKRERRQLKRDMKRAKRDWKRGRNPPAPYGPDPQGHAPYGGAPFGGPSCGRGGFFGSSGPFGPGGPLGEGGPFSRGGPFGRGGTFPPFPRGNPFGGHGGGPFDNPRGRRGGRGGRGGGFFGRGGPFGSSPQGPRDTRGVSDDQGPPDVQPTPGTRDMPPGPPASFPGSWPTDVAEAESEFPPPGPASAAKYRQIAGLETEIASKTQGLETASDAERRAIEKEVEALVEKLENVMVEADEAYARELAARDAQ